MFNSLFIVHAKRKNICKIKNNKFYDFYFIFNYIL